MKDMDKGFTMHRKFEFIQQRVNDFYSNMNDIVTHASKFVKSWAYFEPSDSEIEDFFVEKEKNPELVEINVLIRMGVDRSRAYKIHQDALADQLCNAIKEEHELFKQIQIENFWIFIEFFPQKNQEIQKTFEVEKFNNVVVSPVLCTSS